MVSREAPVKIRLLVAAIMMLGFSSCSSIYYGTMERLGKHKRHIMIDRVKATREAQADAKGQFLAALEQVTGIVAAPEAEMEKRHGHLDAALGRCESKAGALRGRISSLEDVARALFREWRSEIEDFNSDALRAASQQKYDMTLAKYSELVEAMEEAESKLEPALIPLRDQVLFMKHNLNAKAFAGLNEEQANIQTRVDLLAGALEAAISAADKFLAAFQAE